jgi:hypothetical protein
VLQVICADHDAFPIVLLENLVRPSPRSSD